MSFAPVLLALALLPAAAGGARAADRLGSLSADPSPKASARLAELYRTTKNPDQRLWVIHALGARLKERGELSALETLLTAAVEDVPGLRGPALRALMGFTAVPKRELGDGLLARLDAAARNGHQSPEPAVRYGAEDLQRALRLWKEPESRTTPEPPQEEPERGLGEMLLRVLRWLWVLLMPVVVLAWLWLGLPVFEERGEEGRRARQAWGELAGQPLFLLFTGFVWLCLAAMLAGYGFDLLARALGRPLEPVEDGWLRFYLAAVLCAVLPGALAAAALARDPGRSVAAASLRHLPDALLVWLAVAALWPFELLYRLLLRRPAGPGAGPWRWALAAGSPRAGCLTAAVMAGENLGLLPALARCRELFPEPRRAPGFTAFDARFAVLCAAPVLAFFCAIIARGQPVEWRVGLPVVLLGCALWSWAVLAGVLWAVLAALGGVEAAAELRRAAPVEDEDADEESEI